MQKGITSTYEIILYMIYIIHVCTLDNVNFSIFSKNPKHERGKISKVS